MQVPLTATSVPPSYVEQNVSMRNMVPRDRIELSTQPFQGRRKIKEIQGLEWLRSAKCGQRVPTISMAYTERGQLMIGEAWLLDRQFQMHYSVVHCSAA
jgi:hypothetical protein